MAVYVAPKCSVLCIEIVAALRMAERHAHLDRVGPLFGSCIAQLFEPFEL